MWELFYFTLCTNNKSKIKEIALILTFYKEATISIKLLTQHFFFQFTMASIKKKSTKALCNDTFQCLLSCRHKVLVFSPNFFTQKNGSFYVSQSGSGCYYHSNARDPFQKGDVRKKKVMLFFRQLFVAPLKTLHCKQDFFFLSLHTF